MQPESQPSAKILQIMPAPPGWEAVFGEAYEPEKGEAGYRAEIIACWALVEDANRHFVTALVPDIESNELRLLVENEYFLGYRYPTEPTDWTQRAKERRSAIEKNK